MVVDWHERVAGIPAQQPGGEAKSPARLAGAELRRKIWDPLAAHVDGARVAPVVPDGALNLVNFAALPTPTDGYLVEHGPLIHYLCA